MDTDAKTSGNYFTKSVEMLARSGFKISINTDMSDWRTVLLSDPNIPMVNATFDPEHSTIRPGQAFWIGVHDSEGIVAAIADRHFESADYRAEYLVTARAHFDTPPMSMPVTPDTEGMVWSGSIGHSGGLWVHPRAKKLGLSWLLPRMCRALSIQQWDVDRHIGMCFEAIYLAGFPAKVYGFPEEEVWLLADGLHPVVRKPARIYVFHMDRAAIVDQFRHELSVFDRAGDKQLRDIAFIVGQRQNQAAEAEKVLADER